MILESILSIKKRKALTIIEKETTTHVEPFNSSHFGQETFFISTETSEKNFFILFIQKAIYGTKSFAGVTGLEPATPGFGDRCSTN